ncbi:MULTISPECIES: 3'-5' exonuclease [Phnomibacter]|jgi:DNA polymerase-3 subunit epsilon|uniref:3'-5' exonuclease n=1 Tax=Phnomibacter ginsenosidimutans TaxID=2676868 RepID=A0A6I6G8B2_9BACT|nr:3'-5' exonuclease [Phnomibacter ginsenosidimutans]MCA0383761.1 3'-5' exonuclease [Bacteroidota bacterium]QGW28956.1 3'-5' exonuclease [Phnomibacter ginsenosidimutans]
MNLSLTRPLAFIDLETTGINMSSDRIVEIAIVKILPDGTKQVKRKLINPEMVIPQSSIDVHGITNEMVKDAPTFKQAGNEIKQFLENCDLAGYNSNKFDIPLLVEEFLRAGQDFNVDGRKLVDVQKVFHMMEPRTLSAAYKFYCSKELENAHSAEVDATATWEVLDAQVARYPQIGNTVDSILKAVGDDEIVDFARRMIVQEGKIVFNFGKHKGKVVEDVLRMERSYYDWMMQGDFPQHTKQKLTEILHKMMLAKK